MNLQPPPLAPDALAPDATPGTLLAQAEWSLYLNGVAAGELGRRVLDMTKDATDASHAAARALAWWHVAFAERRFGDPARGAEANERAREAFVRLGDERGALLCQEYDALNLRAEGRLDEALAVHLRILSRTDVERPPADLYIHHNARAITRKLLGDIDEMVRDFYRAQGAALQCASPGPQINALVNLGGCHVDLNNLDEAFALSTQAMDLAESAGSWVAFAVGALNAIQAVDGRADPSAGNAVLARLLARAPQLPPNLLEHDAPFVAMAHLAKGDLAGARAWLDRGATAGVGDGDGRTSYACVSARWLLATGDAEGARRVVEERLAEAEASQIRDLPHARMRLLQAAAEACERAGDAQAALGHLRASQALYETLASCGAQARLVSMQVAHESEAARAERDRARLAHEESERAREHLAALNRALEDRVAESTRLNAALHAKMAEAEALQRQLREQAAHDPLTGLYNRRFLTEVASSRLHLALRSRSPLWIVLVDIDHFKQVNDHHGHEVGDEVLVGFARLLGREVRRGDIACRFGGEEFLLLVDATDESSLRGLLGRLQRLFGAATFGPADKPLTGKTFSAGIARLGEDGEQLDALVRVADARMYRAKAAGRARVWGESDDRAA